MERFDRVRVADPPELSLIIPYESMPGFYIDCFAVDLPTHCSLEAFLKAFYTSWIFRLERLILRLALRVPTSSDDLSAMLSGASDKFAVWIIEERQADQMIAKAVGGSNRTRSWFRVLSRDDGGTRLFFGSVLEPEPSLEGAPPRLGLMFRAGIGAHRLYARVLLAAAARKF